MTSRTYLSIGDVLTLLREEFPDVTISKIRFLESQGLVNPERSPSGYRKFFDHDVERLRWVLRQQREHFLPLKVIRDRLAEGNLDDISVPSMGAPGSAGAGAGAGNGKTPHAVVVAPGRPAQPERTEEQMAKADDEAMARILADATRRAAKQAPAESPAVTAAGTPAPSRGPGDRAEVESAGGQTSRRAATGGGAADAGAGALRAGSESGAGSRQAPAAASSAAAATAGTASPAAGRTTNRGLTPTPPAPAATASPAAPSGRGAGAAPTAAPGSGSGHTTAAGTKAVAAGAAAATTVVTGASLTAEELCAASGLTPEELAGLQGFGLIEVVLVAGIPTYDEDALTVANLAAEFRTFGIEPRHLRLYRNAVDREMGLIEQVIIPLLRQRNPESRQRAVDGAEVLGSLGQSMRATLLRSALRRHIGG